MPAASDGRGHRPAQGGGLRRAGAAAAGCTTPTSDRMMLGYQCANSRMTIAVAADHLLETDDELRDRSCATTTTSPRWSSGSRPREGNTSGWRRRRLPHLPRRARPRAVRPLRPHPRPGRPARRRPLPRRAARVVRPLLGRPRDVEVRPTSRARGVQQAIRFNLFTLAQASARADQQGVPAKGVTGSGYEGHYFWDTEVYVVPFLTYTQPDVAATCCTSAAGCCRRPATGPARWRRRGALFPWRTINGEEASAYYAAGTAQVHIDADIAYALMQYVARHRRRRLPGPRRASTSSSRPRGCGPTSASGAATASASFHIHGVTGPDEYTTVVNNNLFTNVMARYNLEQAVTSRSSGSASEHPDGVRAARRPARPRGRRGRRVAPRAPRGCTIPFDEGLGIHPQDDFFLDREVWDLSADPGRAAPAAAALPPAGDLPLPGAQAGRRRARPVPAGRPVHRWRRSAPTSSTTTRSPPATRRCRRSCSRSSPPRSATTRSRCDYFHQALYVDLANLHGNTVDGLHVASAGGVWARLVFGFGGMRDHDGGLSFDPRLPAAWPGLRFRLRLARLPAAGGADQTPGWSSRCSRAVNRRCPSWCAGRGTPSPRARPWSSSCPTRAPASPSHLGDHPLIGGRRADGTTITADVPEPIHPPDQAAQTGEFAEFVPEGPVAPPQHHES